MSWQETTGDRPVRRTAGGQALEPCPVVAPGRCHVFDDLDLAPSAPELELAVAPTERRSRSSIPARKVDVEGRGRALADLPPAPDGGLALIGYAWTVRKRLRQLRLRWEAARTNYERAHRRAETLRTELGAALHRIGSPELGALVAAVDGAARTAEEREAQLAEMRASAADERARQAKALGELERELGPWQGREGRATAEADIAHKELERARGALDRVKTEIAPMAGDPAALAPFEAAYEARKSEATRARGRLDEVEATLTEARAKVAELTGRIDAVEAEGRRVDRELRDAEAAAEAAATDAGESRGAALRKLAREALERGLVPDDLPEGPVARRATSAEADQALDLTIHTVALRVHDEDAVIRGATYAAALAALAVGIPLLAFVF